MADYPYTIERFANAVPLAFQGTPVPVPFDDCNAVRFYVDYNSYQVSGNPLRSIVLQYNNYEINECKSIYVDNKWSDTTVYIFVPDTNSLYDIAPFSERMIQCNSKSGAVKAYFDVLSIGAPIHGANIVIYDKEQIPFDSVKHFKSPGSIIPSVYPPSEFNPNGFVPQFSPPVLGDKIASAVLYCGVINSVVDLIPAPTPTNSSWYVVLTSLFITMFNNGGAAGIPMNGVLEVQTFGTVVSFWGFTGIQVNSIVLNLQNMNLPIALTAGAGGSLRMRNTLANTVFLTAQCTYTIKPT